jgi:hypothetical protein
LCSSSSQKKKFVKYKKKLRVIELEPPKQEEVEPVEEVYPVNSKGGTAAIQKKDPNPPAPYRYCMPAHAEYTPPKLTARNQTKLIS